MQTEGLTFLGEGLLAAFSADNAFCRKLPWILCGDRSDDVIVFLIFGDCGTAGGGDPSD